MSLKSTSIIGICLLLFLFFYPLQINAISPGQIVSDESKYANGYDVAKDSNGNIVLAMGEYIPDPKSAFSATYSISTRIKSGGNWGNLSNLTDGLRLPIKIPPGANVVFYTPKLYIDSQNNYHLFFIGGYRKDFSPHWSLLFYSKYDGNNWSVPINILDKEYGWIYNFNVRGDNSNIYVMLNIRSDYKLDINLTNTLYLLTYSNNKWGSPSKLPFTYNAIGSGEMTSPYFILDQGVFQLVFEVGNLSTDEYDIYYSNTSAGTWSSPENISDSFGESNIPKICNDNNNFYIFWRDSSNFDADGTVVMRSRAMSGNIWGEYYELTPEYNISIGGAPARFGFDINIMSNGKILLIYGVSSYGYLGWVASICYKTVETDNNPDPIFIHNGSPEGGEETYLDIRSVRSILGSNENSLLLFWEERDGKTTPEGQTFIKHYEYQLQ